MRARTLPWGLEKKGDTIMWNCNTCNTAVDDRFDACPQCGTGRNGSAPPVDSVRKKDALQPGLPAAAEGMIRKHSRLIEIIIVLVVVVILFFIAFGG
jgi:hypothetical protein